MSRMGRSVVVGLAVVGSLWLIAPVAAADDQCLAATGAVWMQKRDATCEADGKGSVARVKGTNSTAVASSGNNNTATANGNGCTTEASRDVQTDSRP